MTLETETAQVEKKRRAWINYLLLIAILLAAIYFRTVGLFWGEYSYMHPDERFLIWVGSDLSPVKCLDSEFTPYNCPEDKQVFLSFSEYFDTAQSTLNPHNRGHGFYVYGTLPMFLTRYVVELYFDQAGWEQVLQTGRSLSVLADLLTVLLVFLVAKRLYGKRVGLLAAAFSAAAVLQIQQSHFFTMDTFINFFTFLAFFFAVLVLTGKWPEEKREMEAAQQALATAPPSPKWTTENPASASAYLAGDIAAVRRPPSAIYRTPATASPASEAALNRQVAAVNLSPLAILQPQRFFRHPLFWPSLLFGLALGMAVASKLNAAPMAVALPAAMAIRIFSLPPVQRNKRAWEAIWFLALAAFVSLLAFRIFQPYAFTGPGFFGVNINPQWQDNIKSLRAQSTGDVDFPPAMQWARRPVWFSFQNLVVWGLGLPLGMLAWAGFLWAGWRMLKGEWQRHALIWGWTALYFGWQSLALNPTMRYQLPIYPMLAIFAAWMIVALWDGARAGVTHQSKRALRALALVLGGAVLVATFAYAYGFTRIYVRPFTRVEASRWILQNIPGPINLHIQTTGGIFNQPVPVPYQHSLQPGQPYVTSFNAKTGGVVQEISLGRLVDLDDKPSTKTFLLSLMNQGDTIPLATASLEVDLPADSGALGMTLVLDAPVELVEEQSYTLTLVQQSGESATSVLGAGIATEGDWDDGLPLRMDGYDPYGGIYPLELTFNMYWDDNQDKLARFTRILDQSDYIVMSSNRQWGTLPRLPERFPMTTVYYRELLGCPPEREIVWCYNVARPGKFTGRLGFELVKVFESNSSVGPIQLNDQFAEEAFTVYDHPKVFVFRKTEQYEPEYASAVLGRVDFSKIVRVLPMKAPSYPANLMLPSNRLIEQRLGGSWSELFNTQALQNSSQVFSLLVWYLSVFLLGLIVYPLLRLALPGLADRGYPLARTVGLLALAYLVWLSSSVAPGWLPFDRLTISIVLALMAIGGALLAVQQRHELRRELRERRNYFIIIEGLFLAFFIFDLLIRLGNPDLWHPWKGGERPMDFSYFNAILKSSSFPPYDPWFAGGYLNYYYYGFVFVGVLVKWLGIVPSIAFNLILPTVFSLIAMGAFSLAWNVFEGLRSAEGGASGRDRVSAFVPAIAGALGMAVLGNLGTVRMIIHGYQRLSAPGGDIESGGIFTRAVWTVRGFVEALQGARLPYSLGDWYWIPSRAIPGLGDIEPITEFPFFTVLYSDPHAHLFALPLTLLALSFALSILLSRGRWKSYLGLTSAFLIGGLAIGALRPTNTWDFPTYLAIGVVAVGYTLFSYYCPSPATVRILANQDQIVRFLAAIAGGLAAAAFVGGLGFIALRLVKNDSTALIDTSVKMAVFLSAAAAGFVSWRYFEPPERQQRALSLLAATLGIAVLTGLTVLLYRPYAQWYALGYTSAQLWKGSHTPLVSYLTHWGLFLFIIISWMAWETRDWLAKTPLSSVRKLDPYRSLILAGLLLLVIGILALLSIHVSIGWFVLPLAAWAGVLLLRPGQPDAKRFLLFITGTGLVLTLMVEVIVLVGDIGRMNTVFKFYLQVWTLFAICAAVGLGWLLAALPEWSPGWRRYWRMALVALVAGAALFPFMGGLAKVKDRMSPEAPHTLDGMAYMPHSTYEENGQVMDLSEDYRAIRWMQENVQGSPVIVEANSGRLYRWYTRYTIYTGLPNVVGWEWHQQQQRAVTPGAWVSERLTEVNEFYSTTDLGMVRSFLERYDVRYIVVGQLEQATYSGPGIEKFAAANGALWNEVYRDGETVIYEVAN